MDKFPVGVPVKKTGYLMLSSVLGAQTWFSFKLTISIAIVSSCIQFYTVGSFMDVWFIYLIDV